MKYTILSGLFLFSGLANCQTTVTATQSPNSSQLSKLSSDLQAYESSVMPQYQSILSVAASFAATYTGPSVSLPHLTFATNWAQAVSELNSAITASIPTAIPTDVASFYKSVVQAEASIINKDLAGSASTNSAKGTLFVSGAVAAGTLLYIGLL